MNPKAREILEAGAMSIRRTKKSYARSAIDLCLEQTVNKYAAYPMRGIAAVRNSESACRRWCITLTQRCQSSLKLLIFNQGRNLLNSLQSVEFGVTMLT